MLVTVSTTCPVTAARAPARSLARTRMRGRNQSISPKYATVHTAIAAPARPSIPATMIAAPTMEASAKRPVLITSTVTVVTALAVCICFCAMRPAKSSSKKVTACPIVHRCSRVSTWFCRLGCRTTDCIAAFSPVTNGRTITRNAVAASSSAIVSDQSASGPASIAPSMIQPSSSAVSTSNTPARIESAAVIESAGQAPVTLQRRKAASVRGGGPNAGLSGSMRSPRAPIADMRGISRPHHIGW